MGSQCLLLQHPLHSAPELGGPEGLEEVVGSGQPNGVDGRFHLALSRHDQEGDLRKPRPQVTSQIQPRSVGHVDVGDE